MLKKQHYSCTSVATIMRMVKKNMRYCVYMLFCSNKTLLVFTVKFSRHTCVLKDK